MLTMLDQTQNTKRHNLKTSVSVLIEGTDEEVSHDITQALRRAGAGVVVLVEPEFPRFPGRIISYRPTARIEFEALRYLSRITLLLIGCRLLDDYAMRRIWLYPAEWYDFIPDHTPIRFANGEVGFFRRGNTPRQDNENFLSFGFVQTLCS